MLTTIERKFFDLEKIEDVLRPVHIVHLNKEIVRRANQLSHHRWCNKKTGEWGAGMENTIRDPRRVERAGILGEYAFSVLSNLPVNDEYVEFGDRGIDFVLANGKTVDVKTAVRDYGELLVRSVTANGKRLPLTADYYVSAVLVSENDEAVVELYGYVSREDMEARPDVRAHKGNHLNKAIYNWELHPLRYLI